MNDLEKKLKEIKEQLLYCKCNSKVEIVNNRVTVIGYIISDVESVGDDFLTDIDITGGVLFNVLRTAGVNLLRGSNIGDYVMMLGLNISGHYLLADTVINGEVWLNSLIPSSEGLLQNSHIKGQIVLSKLQLLNPNLLKTTNINNDVLFCYTHKERKELIEKGGKVPMCDAKYSNYKKYNREDIEGYNSANNVFKIGGWLAKVHRIDRKDNLCIYVTNLGYIVTSGVFIEKHRELDEALIFMDETINRAVENPDYEIDNFFYKKAYQIEY